MNEKFFVKKCLNKIAKIAKLKLFNKTMVTGMTTTNQAQAQSPPQTAHPQIAQPPVQAPGTPPEPVKRPSDTRRVS